MLGNVAKERKGQRGAVEREREREREREDVFDV